MEEQQQQLEDKARAIFTKLSAPFTKNMNGKIHPAHKWLPKDGKTNAKKFMCTPYVSGGQVRDRLNEVLGVDGWMFKSRLETDGTRTGSLSICIGEVWIDRDGVGTKSQQEGEKGAETDALKRAARNFGIGAYLEQLAPRWVDKNGKTPVDKKGRALYGNQLHDYLNGLSSEQGLLAQILILNPDAWKLQEFKILWDKLKL